jgi:hypothetical protein
MIEEKIKLSKIEGAIDINCFRRHTFFYIKIKIKDLKLKLTDTPIKKGATILKNTVGEMELTSKGGQPTTLLEDKIRLLY